MSVLFLNFFSEKLYFVRAGYLPSYFSSEWSLAQFRLSEGVKYSVAFGRQQPNTILIIGTDGRCVRKLDQMVFSVPKCWQCTL
jgi:hypothetical protein